MSASPASVTAARAPQPGAPLRARLSRLALRLREGFTGARQAVDRMNQLIDEARLDQPDA
jgi:hypothetical protein